MTRPLALAAVFLALAAAAASGQPAASSAAADRPACEASALDCTKYWTACELLGAPSIIVNDDAPVTEDRVRNAVESRLRAARILLQGERARAVYDSCAGVSFAEAPFLIVSLTTVLSNNTRAAASMFQFRIAKRMFDLATGEWVFANVSFGRTGLLAAHAKDNARADTMDTVYGELDRIINDYLRVNEPACRRLGR